MSITQRFFLTNSAAGFTPTTLRGAWDQTASAVTKALGRLPSGTSTTIGIAETSTTNLFDVLLARFVSDPFDKAYTFTTSDKVQLCAGLKESSTSANDFVHVHIYVTTGNTDTPRGTILTDSIGATEFTATAGFRTEGLKTLAGLACSAGDRIVVEIGYQAQNTVATSFTGTLNYGGTSASGVSAATNVTVGTGWVEFTTSTHFFNTSSVTWDASATTANAALSDGNLLTTVTNAGSNATGSTLATLSRSSGKYVVAFKIKAIDSFGPQFGLATAGLPTTVSPGDYAVAAIPNAEGAAMQAGSGLTSAVYVTTTQISSGFFSIGVGDTVFIAFDLDNKKWYGRVNNDAWCGGSGSGAVPDSGTSPYDLSGDIASGKTWFLAIGYDTGSATGAKNGVELDASAFGHGLTNFLPWDSASGPTYTLALAQGSFSLTGEPVNLLYGRKLSLAQGSYALTGKPVGILRGFKISLAQGAYALTGNAVSLLYGRKLSLAQGAISVAGQSVGLLFNRKLSLAQGSYSVTGNAVGLFRGFKLALAQGVYNLTGQAVGLLYNRKFSLGQGSYAINGQSLSVLRGYLLSLGQGAYTLSGQSVNLLRGYVLALGQGAISLTGQAVSLVYSGAGAATYTFALSCGSYALSGQALSVRYGRRLLLASGAYNLSGQSVSLLRGFRLALASGAYSIAGQAVAFKRSYVMQLAAGLYSVAGQAINLVHATAGVFGYTPRFAFKAEQRNRTFKAEARDRTFTAAPNNRTFKAEARSRTFKADARQRTNED